ncbi:unnamed protein product, partial [Ectocarpus sp. 13 AM-2016]
PRESTAAAVACFRDKMGQDRTRSESKPRCDICGTHSFTESILSCHRCITVQHTFCLPNPLVDLPDRRWLCPACSESSRRQYRSRSRRQSNGSIGRAGKKTHSGFPAANGAAEVDVNASSSRKASKGDGAAVVLLANGNTADGPAAVPSGKGGRKFSTAATTVGEMEAAISSDATPGLSNGLPSSVEEQESSDPGSTVTLFCRRDFRRYLRWKQRELASQDDERRKDEQTR